MSDISVNWQTLPAGRELDRIVADRLVKEGKLIHRYCQDGSEESEQVTPPGVWLTIFDGDEVGWEVMPHYSKSA